MCFPSVFRYPMPSQRPQQDHLQTAVSAILKTQIIWILLTVNYQSINQSFLFRPTISFIRILLITLQS